MEIRELIHFLFGYQLGSGRNRLAPGISLARILFLSGLFQTFPAYGNRQFRGGSDISQQLLEI